MTDNGQVTHRTVSILGSTGSIGTQGLDVIARNPDRFTVVALSYGGAIRKCMRRVAQMCAKHSACEQLDRQEARACRRKRPRDPCASPSMM